MSARDVVADVAIDQTRLDYELTRQATLVAYWNEMLHKVELTLRRQKIDLDEYAATVYESLRQRQKANGEKLTEASFERMVRGMPAYKARLLAIAELDTEASRLRGLLQALNHKRDALVALANNARAEMRSLSATSLKVG